MNQKLILRGVSGIPRGITIGYLITIVLSLVYANGYYSPCVPALISAVGSEINAVVVQTLLCALLGMGFSAASVIWEIENWNLVKQTGIYFGIVSVIMMPIAYFLYWMEHSIWGFLRYFGFFSLIFIAVWIATFIIGKRTVKKMNEKLLKAKNDGKEKG